jgi:hypothetical protein
MLSNPLHSTAALAGHGWGRAKGTMNLDEIVGEVVECGGRRMVSQLARKPLAFVGRPRFAIQFPRFVAGSLDFRPKVRAMEMTMFNPR